jgi:outer membrane protein
MKHTLAIALLGAALIVAGFVRAEAAGTAVGGSKIGVVDLEKTLYETTAGKRASKAFDDTRAKKQGELDKKQKELQAAAAELDKQRMVLKPDVLKARQGELEQKFVEVQQLYVKLERDLAGERAKLIQEILKQASPIIQEIAKQNGIDVIVDRSAVLWAGDGVDLTAALNKKMK